MHELSIAYNLVEIAETAAREAGAERVESLHLRLGLMSGVVKEALYFGYDLATEGTLLQGSRLEIEDVAVVVYCPVCDRESELPSIQSFQCPFCGGLTADIRHGRELELTSMEIT